MSVALSQGMRNAVYSMGDIQKQIDTSNTRLATGKKVNSALDNAGAYFRSQNLQKDARDLGTLLDGMERGSKIIAKTAKAIDGMRSIMESAQALARQAVQIDETTGVTARNALRDQVATLLTQFNALARDSMYDGKSLLTTGTTAATNETINTNVSGGTTIVLTAQNVRLGVAGGLEANFIVANTGFTIAGHRFGRVVHRHGFLGCRRRHDVDQQRHRLREKHPDGSSDGGLQRRHAGFGDRYPQGLHQGLAADEQRVRRLPDDRGHQRGRCEPRGPADEAAARGSGPLAVEPRRPGDPPPVLIATRSDIPQGADRSAP